MGLFHKLMKKLGRYRLIPDRRTNEDYLHRYYLFLKDRKNFPFNIFLHRFLKSDPADVHDHPWGYFTVILKGGYWEWIPQFNSKNQKTGEIAVWRGPGHFRFCKATSYHRIEIDPAIPTWTLFMPGPQKREWGFLVKNKWVPHDNYLKHNQQ